MVVKDVVTVKLSVEVTMPLLTLLATCDDNVQ
jgi:hypothetical protein